MKNIKIFFLLAYNFQLYASYNNTDNNSLDKSIYDSEKISQRHTTYNLTTKHTYTVLSKEGWFTDEYTLLEATYLDTQKLRIIQNLEKMGIEYKIKAKPIFFGIFILSLLSNKAYLYYKKIKAKNKKICSKPNC